MSESLYWSVTVSINGEPVLTIEPKMLSGIPNIEDYRDQIIEAAHNLLAFIGTGESTFDPEAPDPREESMREAFNAGRDHQAEIEYKSRRVK